MRAAWLRRPFARTFDLIASQYGWTDDQILDLTMERVAQVRDVIRERMAEEKRQDLQVRETELRILAGHVHAAAGNKKGMKSADKIRLQPADDHAEQDQRMIPFEQAKRWFGE